MYKILKLNQISAKGLERFPLEHYEVASEIGHPDAILVRSQTLSPDEIAPSIKAIARAGAGVNNIPVAACTERGIPVFNTPGANANAVKELVLAALILCARGVVEGWQYVQTLTDVTDPAGMKKLVESKKKQYAGEELAGKTLGIVGLGKIGSLVADMGHKLCMEVVGYDPQISVDAAWRLSNQIQKMENLRSLLAQSDYISLHLPAVESTQKMINAETVAYCKAGARLLNFSRGEIVDGTAVAEALERGVLSRYATDFPDPQLLGRTDVLQLPHIGASTREAEDACAVMAANQLIDFLEHGNIVNSVNFPTSYLERTSRYRLAVANRNIPGMLGKMMAVLAERDINISEMLNKSRQDVAYNLIDIETEPVPELVTALEHIEGVCSVRVV